MKLGSFSRLAVLGLYLSLAGLVVSCGKGKVTSKDISIEFSFPLDGDRVTSSDDRNDATPDVIEIDVVVRVVGLGDGETVNLSNDIDVSGGTPREISGTVAAGVVQFPSYALPTADEEIVVTLRAALPSVAQSAECDRTNCDEARITVVRRVCEFNTPPSGGPTLTAEDPAYVDATDPFDPFEIDVIADCVGGSAGDFVALTVNGGAAVTATEDAAGRVTYSRVALREGGNDLRVVPVQDATGQTPTGAETQLTVDVDTGACTAWIEPLDGSRLLADFDADADPSTGMQATRLDLVTDCADTARVDLFVSTPGPTVCDGHADPTTCEGDAFCSWSDGEQACLPDCGLASNRVGCTTLGGCSWSVGNGGSCVRWREVTSMCDGLADSGSCEADAICNWDTGECVPDCAASGTRSACEELGGCLWTTTGSGQCLLAAPQTLSDPAGARFRVTGVKLPTSIDPYDVDVAGIVDDGTQTGSAVPVSYWVDPEAPRIVSASPGDGACLGVLQDLYGTPADGIQIDAFGSVSGAQDGTEIWLRASDQTCDIDAACQLPQLCRGGFCTNVSTVTGGNFVITEVEVPLGPAALEYLAFDAAGNQSTPLVADVSVFATAPTISIAAPGDGATLGVADDADSSLDGLQYDVQVAVTDVPIGANGMLVISGLAPVDISAELAALGSADGTITKRATLPEGSVSIRARVQDSCGNDEPSTPISVNVVSQVADLLLIGYTDFATRQSFPDDSTVNVSAVDLDVITGLSASGSDRTVAISHFDGVDTSGPQRCTGTETALSGTTIPAADPGDLLSGLALSEGDNCFAVVVDDGVNTQAGDLVVRRRTAVPSVAITDPTPSASIGNTYTVVVALTGGPSGGANDIDGTVQLQFGSGGSTYNSVTLPAPAGATPLSLANVSLPGGTVDLTAIYADPYGNTSTSSAVTVTVASTGPNVVITAPAGGATVSNTALSITVTDNGGGGTPVTCQLTIDGAPDRTGVAWTDPLVLTPSAPLSEAPHDLRVDCDDAGTNTGSSQTVTVTIDDTAPASPTLQNEPTGTPGRIVFSPPGYVNSMTPDESSDPGLQHTVGVLATTGGEGTEGWVVDLTVTPPGAGATLYTRTLAGGTLALFDGVELGTTEGVISFSATVTDTAGNVSAPTTADLSIDLTPPVLTQTAPPPAQGTLTRADDANVDPTYVDVAFQYALTGAATGSDLSLDIDPAPVGMTAGDLPLLLPVDTVPLRYVPVPFADGTYVAAASVSDEAGNSAQTIYTFDVHGLTARLTWAVPRQPGVLNSGDDTDPGAAGFQGTFAFAAGGFVGGTEVHLCSTVDPVGGSTPCRWGSDGQPDGPNAGVVVGTGFLAGTEQGSSAFLYGVALAEGQQILHAEAREADQDPDTFSSFFDFIVDTEPPVIAAIDLDLNNTGNDDADSGLFRLNATEGTPTGSRLSTTVTVSTTGADQGQTVRLVSDRPSAGTVVGSGTVGATGDATFSVALLEGAQTLTASVTDTNGNPNDPVLNAEPALDTMVDFTPPTVSLPSAAFVPYTSANGTIHDNGTPGDPSDDALEVGISLSVSDNAGVDGATITLRRFDVLSGGTEQDSVSQGLVGGQTTATFAAYLVPAGLNYLEAQLADAAGNVQATPRELYSADFHGPALTLEVTDASGGFPDCTSAGSPCAADILDPSANNNRAVFDPTNADTFRPGGTDLVFGLTGCQNSDISLEDCSANAITVRLESRIAGSGSPFVAVYQSTYGETGDVAARTSYFTKAAGYALDPGLVREVRLFALDTNNNVSTSASVFMQLNVDGVLIEVERLDGGPTGDLLADGTYWGEAENQGNVTVFSTGLRVHVTVIGAQVPTDVDIVSQPLNSSYNQSIAGDQADFAAVDLDLTASTAAPNPNTVTVTVNCGASQCGSRVYSPVIADIVAPIYQYDRCQLCALGVPLVDNGLCATCSDSGTDADPQANIADPATAVAIWNAAADQDRNPANGFTIQAAVKPLRVKLLDVENGQVITVSSTQPGLTGNTAMSTGCPAAATCSATFDALGVPSLAGASLHELSISFTDRAGNPAVADPIRGTDDIIYARTDVIAPDGVDPTVCIGESTTPYSASQPAMDPATYEDPQCAAECTSTGLCDRRAGDASLFWLATADDGATGDPVLDYTVSVAALGIDYPDGGGGYVSYTSCAEIDPDGIVEQQFNLAASAAPGEVERTTVSGLYPHRAYCFVVQPTDDAANVPAVGSTLAERHLPLISYPDTVVFDPAAGGWEDTGAASRMYTDPGFSGSTSVAFGFRAVNLGDMDGDGGDDIAVAALDASYDGAVSVFLSSSSGNTPVTPDVVINGPSIASPFGSFFGYSIAGGDFDADGLADMVICAPYVSVSGHTQAGDSAGALYLYYGVSGTGLRRDVNATDEELPSINPDVALFAPASAHLGWQVAMGNYDGLAGDDLVVATDLSGRAKVYGFVGGSRARFPSSPPAPARIYLDLDSPASGGFSNRPELAISGPSYADAFPWRIAIADLDGNGAAEVVITDHTAPHAAGRSTQSGIGLVYTGGAGLFGEITTPDAEGGRLETILRYVEGPTRYGQELFVVPAPRQGDAADWLMVAVSGADVVVHSATEGTGLDVASYDVGGLPAGQYVLLDRGGWDGAGANPFGRSISRVSDIDGDGQVDLCAAPGFSSGAGLQTFLYSFDESQGAFVKRAILHGEITNCIGVDGYLDAAVEPASELLIASEASGSVSLFR